MSNNPEKTDEKLNNNEVDEMETVVKYHDCHSISLRCKPSNHQLLSLNELNDVAENTTHTEASSNNALTEPRISSNKYNRYVPFFFRHDNEPEATGYAMIAYNNSSLASAAIFFTTALLDLARKIADCEVDQSGSSNPGLRHLGDLEGADAICDKVYGILKPTSLLTVMAVITGAGGSILMPLLGALVDHTCHRRTVGRWTAFLLTIITFGCIFLSEKSFPIHVVLYIIFAFIWVSHSCVSTAYLPDLTKDHQKMAKYMARFSITQYISFILNTILTTIIAVTVDANAVGTAVISQVITLISCVICLGTSWGFLMEPREALKEVPNGSSLLMTGFRCLWETFLEIASKFPALKWFLFMVMFSDAATSALIVVSTTYMETVLEMSSIEIGAVFLSILFAAVPGSLLARHVTTKYDPFKSIFACLAIWILSTLVGAFSLTGRENWRLVYLFALFWGVGFGWLNPTNMTAFVSIIPKGRESEFMGLLLFCGLILSWLPSLVFTILNECNVNMSLGLASLDLFFVISFLFLLLVGSHGDAVKKGLELSG